jgi:hypothetical protein
LKGRKIDRPTPRKRSKPQLPSPIQALKCEATANNRKLPSPFKDKEFIQQQKRISRHSSILQKHAAEVVEHNVAENATSLLQDQSASCEYPV